jgi:hypothetical protein
MTVLARFENTSMVCRLGDWLVFVRDIGWIPSNRLKVGDEISEYTDPPSYRRVMEITHETNGPGQTIWERLRNA